MQTRKPFGRRDARCAAPTTEQRQQWDRLLSFALSVYVPLTVLLYSFQKMWAGFSRVLYPLTGLSALCVCVACIWRGKLLRSADVLLLLFMPLCVCVSAALNYGLSLSIFRSYFMVVWTMLLSLYFALRIAPKPEKLIDLFAAAAILSLSFLCSFILFRATASLFPEIPGKNLTMGCFQLGRLCGLSNANVLSFSCASLCLLSTYAFLRAPGRRRLLYALSWGIGWFTLGLTNCRTSIIGVSVCIGLLVFSARLHRSTDSGHGWRRMLTAAALGALVSVLCAQSLYLPAVIYRGLLTCFGKLTHNTYLLHNLDAMRSRRIIDDDGTMADRFIIWRRVLEDVGKTPLRTWLGVSHMNDDKIGGVYAGHHEIFIYHAHNTYLEVLRRFGVIGFALLMASVARWCAAMLRCLAKPGERIAVRALAAAAAAILLMGLPEQMPFPYQTSCSLSLPFFAICGYLMNDGRESP